jgi:NAD(P)-dependent dehydrogenase (short-subunit alcohol dehydrogenase family)
MNPSYRLDGKVALVTGGGQGVGCGVAAALAGAGAAVAIADVIAERADLAAAAIESGGGGVLSLEVDVADPEQVGAAVTQTVERFGALDILVNNAHTVRSGSVLSVREADAEVVWASGVLGTLNCMWSCRPHLVGGGSIINVASSVMLKQNTSEFALYAATKSAIRSITRTAAVEWGGDGIRVNAISPQTTSPAFAEWSDVHPREAEVIKSEIPLGRFGDPQEDVGPVAVYLSSPEAHYITGSLILVDGGRGHLR